MLYNSLKERLDNHIIVAEEGMTLYDVAVDWLEEHTAEQDMKMLRVRDGYGKHCAAIMIEIDYPDCKYYITVEAEDYRYTEFQEEK